MSWSLQWLVYGGCDLGMKTQCARLLGGARPVLDYPVARFGDLRGNWAKGGVEQWAQGLAWQKHFYALRMLTR
jgi:hypothetical protein